MTTPVRVLLADDHPLVRMGLKSALEQEADLMVVGEAADGVEVQQLCHRLNPDVLVLDLSMPGPPILEVLAGLQSACPDTRILILTAYDNAAYIQGILAAGVNGYVVKDAGPAAVVGAIRAVQQGDVWLSGTVHEVMSGTGKAAKVNAVLASLTPREREILEVIAQGWDNARIAAELCLAEQTVRNYVSQVYEKLGVASRPEAIVWARENGLGDLRL